MWCTVCNKPISKCICPDINERLASLGQESNFVYKKCKVCGLHYVRCKCKSPEWVSSNSEVLLPKGV